MCVGEDHSFGSQRLHVRRLGLGIALQHASPVIQIIDGDEQYVRLPALPARVLASLDLPTTHSRETARNRIVVCFFVFIPVFLSGARTGFLLTTVANAK